MALYDVKIDIQHKKSITKMHITEKCMTPFAGECLRMNSCISFSGDESRRKSTLNVHGRT